MFTYLQFFPPGARASAFLLTAVFVLLQAAGPLFSQQPPPSPVGYTEAREYDVQSLVRLPGSVEAPTISTVASEGEGLVVQFPIRLGDRLEQGQLLVEIRTENLELRLEASSADLREAEARQNLAERNLSRAKELFDSQIFSQQELDQSQFEFNAWEGRIERLRAEIKQIEDDIARSTIHAPFDGIVVSRQTEVGEWLGAGDPILDLMAVDNLQISVDVPERYYSSLKIGRRVSAAFEALGGWNTTAVVEKIIPRADMESRTFPVKLKFTNPNGRAAPGMLVEVSFPAGSRGRATIVPKDAVVRQGAQDVVYVIQNGTANAVPVETGAGVQSWIAVRGAVRPGQQVITRGNERLQAGQPVQGRPVEYKLP